MSIEHQILLVTVAFLTSTLSGMIGMGGGITLLAVMASFFPPAILIPLHGVVQFGSNISRVYFNLKWVNKKLVAEFCVGAILGALVASQLNIDIPQKPFKLGLGIFIFFIIWAPKFKFTTRFKKPFTWLGFFATLVSFLVGATGPFIAPFFLNKKLPKQSIVASKAACQLIIHAFKIFVFSLWGFAFASYIDLLIAMLIAVTLGSYVGKKFLDKVPEKIFIWIFKSLVSFLALRLIYLSIQ